MDGRMPSVLASYLAGLRPRAGTGVPDTELTAVAAIDRAHLTRYARLCGFPDTGAVPATYPHVLAFPLILRLMAHRDFPFPLPGLVHVADRIVRYRAVDAAEPLELRVRAERLADHRRGRTVDVVVTASVAGEPVWSERGTYLRRGPARGDVRRDGRTDADPADPGPAGAGLAVPAVGGPADRDPAGAGPAVAEDGDPAAHGPGTDGPAVLEGGGGAGGPGGGELVEPAVRWTLPGGLGRRYASVSGDRNPIHLSALTARPFGFRGAIAHGMWTAARCLAEVDHRLPEAYTLDIRFRRPVPVPSLVSFGARPAGTRGYRFAVIGQGGRVLTLGTVRVDRS